MEITSEQNLFEVDSILEKLGNPVGLMVQVGTRNAQNFELLKTIGKQNKYPILFKRGFGISLDESINAAEYIAKEGNNKIVFCLRGMQSNFSKPHRNFIDFAHVPVIKRLKLSLMAARLWKRFAPRWRKGKKFLFWSSPTFRCRNWMAWRQRARSGNWRRDLAPPGSKSP